jgi:hypothetical protein
MAFVTTSDYRVVDNPETVTLTYRTNEADRHLDLTHAFRNELTFAEKTSSGGVYQAGTTAYDLPRDLLGDYAFKPGDTLTDSVGNRLNIFSVAKDQAWLRCLCVDPVIAFQLQHTIDVYDLAKDKDAAGAAVVGAEELLYSAVPCRVQWQDARPGTHAGKAGLIKKATIYVAQRLDLTHGSLIVFTEKVLGEGESPYRRRHPRYEARDVEDVKLWRFDLLSWKNHDRIDLLQELDVEARP